MAKVSKRIFKIPEKAVRRQLSQLPVAGQGTKRMLPKSASSALASLDGAHIPVSGQGLQQQNRVPVVREWKPLMPTTTSRARRWIKSGKATPFWSHGVFCVRLNVESGTVVQPVACGIDPGSKKEGFTVKSAAHTFVNINADAVTWVKDAVETRQNMRRARRFRTTPCRSPRFNRARGCLPPSTKARWNWKFRLAMWLAKLYPISRFVVEDIKAVTKGKRRWDCSFSPLEVGKRWFYAELGKLAPVELKQGWETKQLRDELGLKKIGRKMAPVFEAHCVDSWVLANWWTGGHLAPDNTQLLCAIPLQLHRRQLQVLQPAQGGIRKLYGGTRSLEFKRGSLIKHPKHGVVYVGGTMGTRISLHSTDNGRRICQNANPSDCKFLAFASWRTALPPRTEVRGFRAEEGL